ncbi:MAG: hypothetical protein V1834_01890 [Candidatus Micrarchaeota archaeon]
MKFFCKNCKYSFYADGKRSCPRCNSHNLFETPDEREPKKEEAGKPEARKYSFGKYVEGDSKQTWKEFHKAEARACPDCSGTDFELDWKHKEKTCKKCGAILPLARRLA